MEWNVGENERDITNYILQFRASGLRVKKVDFFPSLVCTNTQIPIIGWQNRYITRQEGLILQSLEGLELPANNIPNEVSEVRYKCDMSNVLPINFTHFKRSGELFKGL